MTHELQWGAAWITQDNPIFQGAVEIKHITVTPTAGTVGDVTLRHGKDTGDPIAGVIRTASGASKPLHFGAPVVFDRGLFVDIGSNVTGVLLIWRPYQPPDR